MTSLVSDVKMTKIPLISSVKSVASNSMLLLGDPVQTSSLKTKDNQFDNFFITGGTESCHYDNLQCHQWW